MKRIGVFGGSFDPVHYGHIVPILEAKHAFGLEKLIYLPAFRPPHKPDRAFAPAHHRLAMLALATLPVPSITIDPMEILSGSVRYTVESLDEIASREEGDLFLIIGSDNLAILPTWHDVPRLLSLATLIVLDRPSIPWQEAVASLPKELARRCAPEGKRIVTFTHETLPISSSTIRQRRREGDVVTGMTPASVILYMERHHLYEKS